MRCRVAQRRIDEGLECALEARLELEQHLAGCAACRQHAARARALQELLEVRADPTPPVPDVERAVVAVLTRLERGEGRAWRPPRRHGPLLVAALALAMLAAALWSSRARTEVVPAPVVPAPSDAVATPPAEAESPWTPSSVEATVRAALLAAFGESGVDEAKACTRFAAATREPARAGWPVRRFVEAMLENPDERASVAAARCLAALGEVSAIPALERALARPPRVREGALEALGTLGSASIPALERALADPGIGPRALLQICRLGGPHAARALERAARAARPNSTPSRAALLDALTTTGPSAVASLLELASEAPRREEAGEILARLALVEGAGPALADLLPAGREPADLLYRALLEVLPSEALPWLEERSLTHRERAAALETIGNYPGSAPLASLLRLARAGRIPIGDVLALATNLFERDGERLRPYSEHLSVRGRADELQAWCRLLIESAHPAAAEGLVPLVFSSRLSSEERQWAALAVGELGGERAATSLLARLREGPEPELRTVAAALLSIHAHLGASGVQSYLAPCDEPAQARVLAALAGARSGGAVLVYRVARALEGAFADRPARSTDSKEAS